MNKNTVAISDTDGMLSSVWRIHSVKRLSDGEVFSVGDKLTDLGWGNDVDTITSIYPINGTIAFGYGDEGAIIIKAAKKAPKEEQEPIKVESIAFYTSFGQKQIRDTFAVNLSNNISEDKLQSIKSAIEGVLNETLVELNNEQLGKILMSFHKNHSEELLQARRDAFDAAREVVGYSDALKNSPVTVGRKYKDNEDYINSLNK